MNTPLMRVEHRQQQTLTPRLQQAVRLLQLSSLDFAQEIRDAMGKNPFLEPEDSEPGQEEAPLPGASATALPTDGLAASEPTADHGGTPNEGEPEAGWERDSWQQATGSSRNGGSDGEASVMDMVPADVGLRQHLRGQTQLGHLAPRDHLLVNCVIESLDDDGYLRTELRDLDCLKELDPAVTQDELDRALSYVQRLEPAGVGARNVAECLQLQLHLIECPTTREVAAEIIAHHLERLAHRDSMHLARVMDRPVHEVEAACNRIRHMDPRPGWRHGAADIQYVTPDVIARKVKGRWMAMLNPAVVPRVRLNQVYAELFRRHRDGQHSELAAHLQEARWTVRNVEQRFATILSVAEAILRRQHHFLEFGPMAMKPLGLKEIAEEVGLHESTVSRVTNNKYMATPAGVFELKYFFSRSMPTQSGGACSATAIRGLIKDMIEAEDGSNPLSDAEIARQLARQGLTVARRTVTKYRQLLKLPAVEQRRRHT